ncbi:MAG: DUF4124 domain-containing protein [Luteimonas sp.]
MTSSPTAPSFIAHGLVAAGVFAASLAAPAVAGEVYQWKDAKGVTQYSSSPPPKGIYKVRTINNAGAANTAVSNSAAPSEDPQCAPARANLATLQGKGAVQQDTNGDGKADKTLSESERATQLALAQAVINANKCAASAIAKK